MAKPQKPSFAQLYMMYAAAARSLARCGGLTEGGCAALPRLPIPRKPSAEKAMALAA